MTQTRYKPRYVWRNGWVLAVHGMRRRTLEEWGPNDIYQWCWTHYDFGEVLPCQS